MRLPPPARAATAAGILLVVSVLLLGVDLAVVEAAGGDLHAVPFFVQTENATVAGMRITNAGGDDLVRAYEMFATGACGYTYRNPIRLILENGTRVQEGDRIRFNESDIWVGGNVTFYVLESLDTPDLLRGKEVPSYASSRRHANPPSVFVTNGTGDEGPPFRIVRVHINCWGDGEVTFQRGPHPGTSVRFAFDSQEPWLGDLPVNQGVDLLYLLRADEQADNETYALLAENLQRGGEFWTYSLRAGSVYDDDGVLPDRILRSLLVVSLALAGLMLVLALRRAPPTTPPTATDAALAVAAAGEGHLRRLRATWLLVGALLVPLLAAATYVAFTAHYTPPGPSWETTFAAAVLGLDVAVLGLWALTLRRAHGDLVAWRRAWTRLDQADLDAL